MLEATANTSPTLEQPQLAEADSDEWLAHAAAQLARRNEALEDFAALVAHELKRRSWLP
jgi:hypothetical protein